MDAFDLSALMPEVKAILTSSDDGGRIRVTSDGKVSVFDIVTGCCGVRNPRDNVQRMLKKHKEIAAVVTYNHFPGQGQRPTPVIPIAMASLFIEAMLSDARMSISKKKTLLGHTPMKKYSEVDIHDYLKKAFSDEVLIPQYPVDRYRIDLYAVDHNIAIECDEDAHKQYDQDRERLRTEFISNTLKCRWIRYDPYCSDFDIFELIDRVRIAIYKHPEAIKDGKSGVE